MNSSEHTEIDLRIIGKKIVNVFRNKKTKFTSIFILIFLLSTLYFLKVIYIPSYKASFILKSKYVKFDQVKQNLEQYNYYINAPELNPLSKDVSKAINLVDIRKIDIVEVKNNDDLLNKDNENRYKLYNITIVFKEKPLMDNISKVKNIILNDIQENCVKDNEIIENKVRLQNNVKELDSLIKVAYDAGNGYKNKIGTSSAGQLLVMNDLYKGINELINQKINCQKELNMHKLENIIFQSSPMNISNKIEYPWVIFAIAFLIWSFIVSIWTIGIIVFTEEK
jgi:hypothetical protein